MYSSSLLALAAFATTTLAQGTACAASMASSSMASTSMASSSTLAEAVVASYSAASYSTTLVTSAKAGVTSSSAVPATTAVKLSGGSQTSQCGQYATQAAGSYYLANDLWNEGAGSGSQCSSVNAFSDSTVAWSTSWSWSGGQNQVKSYANVIVNQDTIQKLSSISSIPTSWSWSYSGNNIVADVSYDMFLGDTPSADGTRIYEIMVWLGALGGAGPISSSGSPVDTPTIGSTSFDLYQGPNGASTVFSFVASSKDVTNYSGDLIDFFTYLEQNHGVSSDLYLMSVGAGTEPFTGSDAVLTVSSYSVSIS